MEARWGSLVPWAELRAQRGDVLPRAAAAGVRHLHARAGRAARRIAAAGAVEGGPRTPGRRADLACVRDDAIRQGRCSMLVTPHPRMFSRLFASVGRSVGSLGQGAGRAVAAAFASASFGASLNYTLNLSQRGSSSFAITTTPALLFPWIALSSTETERRAADTGRWMQTLAVADSDYTHRTVA